LAGYDALTFDCFGTLVDWRGGMRAAIRALPSLGTDTDRVDALIAAREEAERWLQRGGFLPYHEILARSIATAWLQVFGKPLPAEQAQAFAAAQADWPAFADSPAALRRLARVAPLALLSNCDPEPLRACAERHLRAPIALFVDAQRARSYKPASGHWHAALAALNVEPARVLHVSAYAFYDLRPAHVLGFATAFVARDGERPPEDVPLAFRARDLSDLADQLGA
jgi:2-haloalkanoic acid dehalogenase type II